MIVQASTTTTTSATSGSVTTAWHWPLQARPARGASPGLQAPLPMALAGLSWCDKNQNTPSSPVPHPPQFFFFFCT